MSIERHSRPYLAALLHDLARPISEEDRLAIAKLLERDEQAAQLRSGRRASIETIVKSLDIAFRAEESLLGGDMPIKSVAQRLRPNATSRRRLRGRRIPNSAQPSCRRSNASSRCSVMSKPRSLSGALCCDMRERTSVRIIRTNENVRTFRLARQAEASAAWCAVVRWSAPCLRRKPNLCI
jgi:hypothetical protein